jgi:hypothetical protein
MASLVVFLKGFEHFLEVIFENHQLKFNFFVILLWLDLLKNALATISHLDSDFRFYYSEMLNRLIL